MTLGAGKGRDETREGEMSGSGGREADGGGWGSGDEKLVTDRKERSSKEKGSERNKEHMGLKTRDHSEMWRGPSPEQTQPPEGGGASLRMKPGAHIHVFFCPLQDMKMTWRR